MVSLINPNDGKSLYLTILTKWDTTEKFQYFANCILNDKPITVATPESTMETIKIAEAEEALLTTKEH